MDVFDNVRAVYKIRSQYIHHRISSIEEATLDIFTANAHAEVFFATLKDIENFKTPQDFINAIDRVNFGG